MRRLGDKATNAPSTWHTWDEIHFLERLGSWALKKETQQEPPDKKTLLQNYRDSMKLRVNWGEIDPVAVKNFINKELLK